VSLALRGRIGRSPGALRIVRNAWAVREWSFGIGVRRALADLRPPITLQVLWTTCCPPVPGITRGTPQESAVGSANKHRWAAATGANAENTNPAGRKRGRDKVTLPFPLSSTE
jgi:hypothetical protein